MSEQMKTVEGTLDEISKFVSELPASRYHVEITDLNGHVPECNLNGEPKKFDALQEAIDKWNQRTPEQVAADRADVLAGSIKPRPLPPGKTLQDVIVGMWPGDETDEEIFAALEELS